MAVWIKVDGTETEISTEERRLCHRDLLQMVEGPLYFLPVSGGKALAIHANGPSNGRPENAEATRICREGQWGRPSVYGDAVLFRPQEIE